VTILLHVLFGDDEEAMQVYRVLSQVAHPKESDGELPETWPVPKSVEGVTMDQLDAY
jgi:hypothetical protein